MSKTYKNYPLLSNDRINFSKISADLELPDLVEIQTKSYQQFLEKGIDEALREIFPIASYNSEHFIDYYSFRLDEPKTSYAECKRNKLTYAAKLYADIRFRGADNVSKGKKGAQDNCAIYLGEIPLMSPSGTFVISGVERVIVSQIVRSAGAYLRKEISKSGELIYNADIIPSRGTWLEFETDQKGYINVRIDRQKKMLATVFLRAIGLDEKQMLNLFGSNEMLVKTIEKDGTKDKTPTDALKEIFSKLKNGEPYTQNGAALFLARKFFDYRSYDIGSAGRFKCNKKLGIYSRLVNRYVAEDIADENGEILFAKGHLFTEDDVNHLREIKFFENPKCPYTKHVKVNKDLIDNLKENMFKARGEKEEQIKQTFAGRINVIKVYTDARKNKTENVIGTDLNLDIDWLSISDIVALFSYLMNIMAGFGEVDDIDNLANRRIRCIGELMQEAFKSGLSKLANNIQKKILNYNNEQFMTVKVKEVIGIKPLSAAIREFFMINQLSQVMDQVNPLSELTNKRRISALGSGGISRDSASIEVRDVHATHYGRICPIETPEGQNIGLITNLASYARVNEYGFIETPYRIVRKDDKGVYVTKEIEYLTADKEIGHYIAGDNLTFDESGYIIEKQVVARHNGETVYADINLIDYMDVSPKQVVSIAAACIPFLENDDAKRSLMGANMQRQALPLIKPTAPYVGTGLEHKVAKDSGLAVIASNDGVVKYVDSTLITVSEGKVLHDYELLKFERSNQGTCINQHAIVKVGDKVVKGQIIADGPSMDNGDLALGQNVTVAFMTWEGYNYEDAVIMSERLVKDDVYTSIHIEEYVVDCRESKQGCDEITRDIPGVGEKKKACLDENGIAIVGAEVHEGDIIVGKTTPKGQSELSAEEKIFNAIFSKKSNDRMNTSKKVPHGGSGTVIGVKVYSQENKDEMQNGVLKSVHVFIAQKRKISEGDKMSGRHGNKGVISRILPVEDMPFLADGTPVDIMLNPLGVPSRMNIGQILEMHLGYACKKLGLKVATPVFDGISNEEIFDLMAQAGIDPDGKTVLYDGRTGERFDERISVGCMYMIKLVHMVDDKLHARASGPYSLVTQQPLGGKAQNGGQRFGEMEVWALEAYGAAHILQEMLTIKSDDRVGRRDAYRAIIEGEPIPKPGISEAFRVLIKELKGLCLNVELKDDKGMVIDTDKIDEEIETEERKINSYIRNMGGAKQEEDLASFVNEDEYSDDDGEDDVDSDVAEKNESADEFN